MRLDFNDKNLKLKKELSKMLPYDIAEEIKELDMVYQYKVMKALPGVKMCKVFMLLEDDLQEQFFLSLSKKQKVFLLNTLEIDDLKEFISKYHITKQEELLNYLSNNKHIDIKKLLIYDKEDAPSIMTLGFVKINENMNIKDATKYVFTSVSDTDYVDILYVVDDTNKLKGVIRLKDLIIARPSDSLKDLIIENYHYVENSETIETAIEKIKAYDLSAIPVLDYEKNILGIITADDVLDELVQRREEEYKKLANLKYNRIDDSPLQRTLQRLPWLILAMIVNLLIARFNLIFDKTLEAIYVLVVYQALVLSMAGNIGTQAMGVTIIKISKGEFDDKTSNKATKHILKELTVSIINATTVAIFSSLYVIIYLLIKPEYPEQYNNPIFIGLIVLISMFISMIISAFAGVIMPIIAYRLKLDPGNITGPILTTINDFFALATYFATASLFIYLHIIGAK